MHVCMGVCMYVGSLLECSIHSFLDFCFLDLDS